jgi:predicted RecB family nuclease
MMAAKITSDVLESYLYCKFKGYLKLIAQQGTKCDFEAIRTELRAEVRLKAIETIIARHACDEVTRSIPLATVELKQGAQYILDSTLEGDALTLHFDGLKRTAGASNLGDFHYLPVLFHEGRQVKKEQRRLLEVYGMLLAGLQGRAPAYGVIWHGRECKATRVKLNPDHRLAERVLRDLREMAAAASPPRLLLNDHCQVCEFRERCHAQAVQEDNISLMRGLPLKEIAKQNKTGVFTVTQYSYTFRLRRERKRESQAPRKHHHSLQALAVREKTIFIAQKPNMPTGKALVYMDVEGMPDRERYYLIGLRISTGESTSQHSFWADNDADEQAMWYSFLRTIEGFQDCPIFHYGSYESHFLKVMKQRYGGDPKVLCALEASAVNALALIYSSIYYPTYSNDLKSIASCLGFAWSIRDASGIQAMAWRHEWEKTSHEDTKQKLLTYNLEDCAALEKVVRSLYSVSGDGPRPDPSVPRAIASVDDIKEQSHRRLGHVQFALPELAQITRRSYFTYQRDKILFRTSPILKRSRQLQTARRKKKHRVNSRVVYRAPRQCPRCEETSFTVRRSFARKITIDLKVFTGGIKKWVTEHVARRCRCCVCGHTFHPRRYLAVDAKYGEVLKKWIAYVTIALRQTNENVVDGLEALFKIPLSPARVTEIRQAMAQQYRKTYNLLLTRLLQGPVIHGDETKVCIKGRSTNGYVWAFASMEAVYYLYNPTREGNVVLHTLKGFKGVLISDFYSAYDAPACPQQKCLIHLARDFNDDLLKNPFDEELKQLASRFAFLLQQIVQTIDRFGLKRLHLNKHNKDVQAFYSALISAEYKSELAQYYQKRILKYKEKLFVFLNYDGVPWNNNTAENAVKLIAARRKIMGTPFTEDGIKDYLVLLSIFQTLRYHQASLWDFLLSGEIDVHAFVQNRR